MHRLAFVALAACGSPANTDLAGLPGLAVVVDSNRELDRDDDDARPSEITINLYYDAEAFFAEHGACATIDDVEATLAGHALDLTMAGASVDSPDDCASPFFRGTMEIGVADEAHLVVRDASREITAHYAAGSLSRVAHLTSHQDWRFAPGETVTVAWSHPIDFAALDEGELSVGFHRGTEPVGFDMESVSQNGTEITFTIPSPSPLTGDGLLDFFVGQWGNVWAIGDAASCRGAASCRFATAKSYKHSVQIRN